MNQIQRGQDMVQQLVDAAREANATVLFSRYSAEDFPNAITAGFSTVSFEEYQQRLAGAVSQFEQQGLIVNVLDITTEQMRDAMQRHDLPNTPDGRAAAIGYLSLETTSEGDA